jgi:hypothetical protein
LADRVAAHYFVESRPVVPDTDSAGSVTLALRVVVPSITPRLQLTAAPVETLRHVGVIADHGIVLSPTRTTTETAELRAVVPLTESPEE